MRVLSNIILLRMFMLCFQQSTKKGRAFFEKVLVLTQTIQKGAHPFMTTSKYIGYLETGHPISISLGTAVARRPDVDRSCFVLHRVSTNRSRGACRSYNWILDPVKRANGSCLKGLRLVEFTSLRLVYRQQADIG